MIKARIGQGRFRDALLKRDKKCLICGIENKKLLYASHIKPWSECKSDEERLDPANGLILCAIHDALFDKCLISFDEDGKILISSSLNKNDREVLDLNSDYSLPMSKKRIEYMSFHKLN